MAKIPTNQLEMIDCSDWNNLDKLVAAVRALYTKNKGKRILISGSQPKKYYTDSDIWLSCIYYFFGEKHSRSEFEAARKKLREESRVEKKSQVKTKKTKKVIQIEFWNNK